MVGPTNKVQENSMKIRSTFALLLSIAGLSLAATAHAAPTCPNTANTNTDCGFILTIGPGGVISGAPVAGANPYDGSDDALIGVVNNSGAAFTGSIQLSGSGNGGGLFAFDGDGICTFISCAWSHPTGYEGPLNTFTVLNLAGTLGDVNISGLAAGATTYFSLEGSPASITVGVGPAVPEPSSLLLIGTGVLGIAGSLRRKLLA
jgi:hypothetical protein